MWALIIKILFSHHTVAKLLLIMMVKALFLHRCQSLSVLSYPKKTRVYQFSCLTTLQRVTRPRGGINEWLHWLPVSLHKKLDYVIRRIYGDSRFLTAERKKLVPLPAEYGVSSGLSSVLEADAKQIATLSRETFEKYVFVFIVNLSISFFLSYVLPWKDNLPYHVLSNLNK